MNNNQNEVHVNVQKAGKTGLFTNYIFKAIPLAFDESLSYYEALCGLLNYLKNTVIPVLNNNADAIVTLQNNINEFETNINQEMANFKTTTNETITIFKNQVTQTVQELENYMNNYFANLDVQDEINNKLDQMVLSGTLQEIISVYLNSIAIFGYTNVYAMKNSANLINGSYAKTLGYYSKDDGGSALYKIRTKTLSDEPDSMFLIQMTNPLLVAELVIENDVINIKQLGARPQAQDGTKYDIKNYIDGYISYLDIIDHLVKLYIPAGVYYTSPVTVARESGFEIYGDAGFAIDKTDNTVITSLENNQSHVIQIGNTTVKTKNWKFNNITLSTADFVYSSSSKTFNYSTVKTITNQVMKQIYATFGFMDKVMFIYINGEALNIRSCWENYYGVLNFREINNINDAILTFDTRDTTLSADANITACTFENVMFEATLGDLIKCNTHNYLSNCVFNNVNFEDHILNLDGITQTKFTDENIPLFDEDEAVHFSMINVKANGTFGCDINNIELNNFSYFYKTLEEQNYVYDQMLTITGDYGSIRTNINNINVVGMTKNGKILKNVATNRPHYESTINISNVINTSQKALYFDTEKFPYIKCDDNLKGIGNTNNYVLNNDLTPAYKTVFRSTSATRGFLKYDPDTINNLNLALNMIDTSNVHAKFVCTGTHLIIRAKVENGVNGVIVLNKPDNTYKGCTLAGTGDYAIYDIDVSDKLSIGDLVSLTESNASASSYIYIDYFKFM